MTTIITETVAEDNRRIMTRLPVSGGGRTRSLLVPVEEVFGTNQSGKNKEA
jgi:hypothetical protein